MLDEFRKSNTSIFLGCRESTLNRDLVTSFDLAAACHLHRVIGENSDIRLHAATNDDHLRALIADNRHIYVSVGSPRSNPLSEIVLNSLFGSRDACPFAFFWGPGQERRSEYQLELSDLRGLKSHELDLLGRGDGGAFVYGDELIVVRTRSGADGEWGTGAAVVVAGRAADRRDRVLATICGVSGPDTLGAAMYAAPEHAETSGIQRGVPETGVLVAPLRVTIQWRHGDDCVSDIRRVRKIEPIYEPRVWDPEEKQWMAD